VCVFQVRKSSLSQVLNAEAYMLFYKKGVELAKLTHNDGLAVRQLSATGEFCAPWLCHEALHNTSIILPY